MEGVSLVTLGLVDDAGDGPERYISGPNDRGSGQSDGNVGAEVSTTVNLGCNVSSGQPVGIMVAPDTYGMGNTSLPEGAGLTMPEVVNNVGDGPGRYTSGPNDGERPSSYTFGHGGDVKESTSTKRDVLQVTGGGPATTTMEPRRAEDVQEQRVAEAEDESDNMAIAGDPLSTLQLLDRPRRTVHPLYGTKTIN